MTITLHALTLLAITMITARKQLQIGQSRRRSPSTYTNRAITFGGKILFLWRLARCCYCYHAILIIVHEGSRNFFPSKIHHIACLRLQVRKNEVMSRGSRGWFYLTLRHYHQCRRTNGGSGNWVQPPNQYRLGSSDRNRSTCWTERGDSRTGNGRSDIAKLDYRGIYKTASLIWHNGPC